MWVLYEREGGLPAILKDDALYFLPLDFIDDYRAHPFSLLFTQAGQVGPKDDGPPLFNVEVKDEILGKVGSIVGATSPVEAYGYCLWFFLRILNFAREHYPGGIPGVSSGSARASFSAFFGLDPAYRNLKRVRRVSWNECLAVTRDHAQLARSPSAGARPAGSRRLYPFLEKLVEFQEAVRRKDPWLAGRITTIALALLKRKGPVSNLSEEELACMGPKLAPYARRLFQGESPQSVARDVPACVSNRVPSQQRDPGGKDLGNGDGSRDNANRLHEGE
jgi:hypothetical protein